MAVAIVFETHSLTEDNHRGVATGWHPGRLSEQGRALAAELGNRRRDDGLAAVFTSDLARAVETAEIAFTGSDVPLLHDWRLRECDYGDENSGPAETMHAHRMEHLDTAYPGGESWREAITRVGRFLDDLPTRWDDARVLVIGHVATRWGLEHRLLGTPLETLATRPFDWQEGWEYTLG